MAAILVARPNELPLHITKYIHNDKTLRNLFLTCKRFQEVAEPTTYQSISLTTTAQLNALLKALQARPARKSAIKSIEARLKIDGCNNFALLRELLA
ncbi:hypothetical protein K470DRAFT_258737 [Piedraia hortae CBS 480.64]|uniref:Uncharacterized protein n=1 Tax=Piedraia hortae CBS 480.64 TaxID=1314780 RepID=A0A6A7BWF8_9PEZI|nr:hypothetical protein K470DRAFT_258737 [Piedraia hortae CBS 480.64]